MHASRFIGDAARNPCARRADAALETFLGSLEGSLANMSIHRLKIAPAQAFRAAGDLVRAARSVVLLVIAASIVAGCANPSLAPVEERPAVKGARERTPGAAAVTSAVTGRAATYTVRRGDTLYQIALDNGLDYRELAAWNHIENIDRIYAGQVLQLNPPGQATPATNAGMSAPLPAGSSGSVAGAESSAGVTVTPLRAEPAIVASTTQAGGALPAVAGAPAVAAGGSPPVPGAVAPGPVAGSRASTQGPIETEPKAVKLPYSDRAVRELNLAASSVPAPSQATPGGATGSAGGERGTDAANIPSSSGTTAATPSQTPVAAAVGGPSQAPPHVANAAPTQGSTVSSASDDQLGWVWPAKGKVIAQFSDSSTLKGIDIAGAMGEPVYASAAGKVVYAGSGLRGYGKLIIIKHNAMYLSAYAHNSAILVKEGQQVARGQEIAQMGSTDSDRVKLHFEIRRYGKPMDPEKYLPPA